MATDVNFGSQQYFGFNPLAVPNCQLWLDAADTATTLQTFSISSSTFVTTTAATVTYSGTLTSVNNFYGGTVVMNGQSIGSGGSGTTPVSGLWAPSATSGRWYSYINDGSFNKAVLCEFVLTGSTLTVRAISAGYTATTANFLNANSSGAVNDTRYATYNAATVATTPTAPNYGVQSFVMNTGGGTGTSVGLWRDKSGNERNAVANTAITYNANGLGTTYPALTFTSSQWLSGPISITGTTMTIFCVFSMSSASPFAARVLALAAPEANDFNNGGYVGILRQSSSAMGPYRNGTYTSSSTPYSTRLFTTTYFDGTNQYTSTNGGTFASNASSGSFAVTSYRVANNTNTGDSAAGALYGFVGEILVYNTALTTSQRQQVDGYLAWKWGVQSDLPIIHSFKRNPPAMRLFQPVDVLNCAIWVDPADRSSILALSGNQPTSIRSKGHQTITLDNAQPTNNAGSSPWTSWPPPGVTNYGTQFMTNSSSNLNTLQFTQTSGSGGQYGNGYNGSYLRVPSVTFTSQQRSMFFVVATEATGIDEYAHIFSPTIWQGSPNVRQRGLLVRNGTAFVMLPVTGSGVQELAAQAAGAPVMVDGTPYMFAMRHTTSTASNYTSINGTSSTVTNQALTTGYRTGTDEHALGIFFAYTRQLRMGDFLLYDGAIQDFEIRQIEGYLAWKWGLRGSLPTTHPFRNFPPATTLFVPPFLSNLALWFDAADPNTLTLSGSSVSTWSDKSGNGRNATQATSSRWPTLQANQRNGLPAIQWDGAGDALNGTMTYPTNGQTTLFVVFNQLSTTGNLRLFDINGNSYGNFGAPQADLNADVILWLGGSVYPTHAFYTQAAPSTGWKLYSVIYNGSSSLVWRNGNSMALNGSGVNVTPTGNGFTLGGSSFGGTGEAFNGMIAELVFYFGNLTTPQRQQVEGYLAWKWGLRENLPEAHPYYKFRP